MSPKNFSSSALVISLLTPALILSSCSPQPGSSRDSSGTLIIREDGGTATDFGQAALSTDAEDSGAPPRTFIQERVLRDSEGRVFGTRSERRVLDNGQPEQSISFSSRGPHELARLPSLRKGANADSSREEEPDAWGVIVEMKEEPVLSVRAKGKKRGLQDSVIRSLEDQQRKNIESQQLKVQAKVERKTGKKLAPAKTKKSKSLIRARSYKDAVNGFALLDISVKEAQSLLDGEPEVKRVVPNVRVQVDMTESVGQIKADQLWSQVAGGGAPLDGTGMKIGILDTGVDYRHPDLGGCYGPNCKVVGGYDFVNNDADPVDDHGHGTHCAATAAGNGTLKLADGPVRPLPGVAPGAKIYAYKVLSASGSGYSDGIIAAIEACADPDKNGDFTDHLHVCSMSLGGRGDPDDVMSTAVDRASSLGVVFAIAAGNSGPHARTIGSPGTSRNAITVAASCKGSQIGTDSSYCTTPIAKFSSVGPVIWMDKTGDQQTIAKPDIAAPGHRICAAQYSTWQSANSCGEGHIAISGTSMATPHLAGVAALILQAHPEFTPAQVKELLKSSAKNLGVSADFQGAGEVDAVAALNLSGIPNSKIRAVGLPITLVDPVTSLSTTLTKNLTLTNISNETLNYSLSYIGTTAGVTATITPTSLSIPSGGNASVQVNFRVDHSQVAGPQNVLGKVLLASTSGDLSFGTSILVGSRLKAEPETVDFGVDLATLRTWTSDRSVQLTNSLRDSSSTYSVSIAMKPGSAYAGIVPQAPGQITIPAGGSAALPISVTTTNSSLSDMTYYGEVKLLSAQQSLVIPFKFFKGYLMRLDFGATEPGDLDIYVPGPNSWSNSYYELLKPGVVDIQLQHPGPYSVATMYRGADSRYRVVAKDGITAGDGSTVVPMSADLATHLVKMSLLGPTGTRPSAVPELLFSVEDTNGSFYMGSSYSVGDAQGVEFYTNTLPERFRTTLIGTGNIDATTRVHWNLEKFGMTAPHTFTNSPNDFVERTVVGFKNSVSADTGKIGLNNCRVSYAWGFVCWLGADDSADVPYKYHFMTNITSMATRTDLSTTFGIFLTAVDGKFDFISNYLLIGKNEEIQITGTSTHENPLIKTAADAMKYARMPSAIGGVLLAGAGPVVDASSLKVSIGGTTYLRAANLGTHPYAWNGGNESTSAIAPTEAKYSLFVNGTSRASGVHTEHHQPKLLGTFGPGNYRFEMERPTLLRGITGVTRAVREYAVPIDAEYSSNPVDLNPPALVNAQVLANGFSQGVVDPAVQNQLQFKLNPIGRSLDDGTFAADSLVNVSLEFSSNGSTFVPVPVSSIGVNQYRGALPMASSSQQVTFRVSARDLRGNSLVTSFQVPTGTALPASLGNGGGTLPSPSPSPTPTVTASPSPSPAPTPTLSPLPSPSPTPTMSPSPSPTKKPRGGKGGGPKR